MSDFLNNYFGFNKQQRNGLFVLILISITLLLARLVYPVFIKPGTIVLLDLPLIEQRMDSANNASKADGYKTFRPGQQTGESFPFDPNTVSKQELLRLGLKEKTAQILIKFRNRGFVFKQKTDLRKVYGISDALYLKLEPYILIPGKALNTNNPASPGTKENQTLKQASSKIELNSADSAGLVSLNGIGPAFAKRILKYRTVLGGYASVDQLKEVYGFSEELYEKVKNNVYVNPVSIKKINLNKDDFKTVNKHPYLSYEHTQAIFNYRRKSPISTDNLKEILADNSLYQKLLPYLIFE